MKKILNTVYTVLLVVLIVLSWRYGATNGFVTDIDANGVRHYTKELLSSGSNDDWAVLQGIFLFPMLLLLQIARLKFGLKYLNIFAFLVCWSFHLLLLVSIQAGSIPLTLQHNLIFASWLVCFIAILPAFLLMWRDAYVRPLSKTQRHDAIGSLPAAGAVS